MRITRFDPVKYLRVRDIPQMLVMAISGVVRGRFRFAYRLCRICIRVLLVALGLAALSGCATTQRYSTVYCISKDQVLPAEPDRVKDKLTGKADEDTRVLAGGLIRWQAYGRGLRTILEGCREK